MGDTSKHLTSFKVENFKRFESFEMKDLGQFNLIVGDNNVGKTSVLEALLVCPESWIFLNRLHVALDFRNFTGNNPKQGDLEFYSNRNVHISERYTVSFNSTFSDGTEQINALEFEQRIRFITKGFSDQSKIYTFYDQTGINYNLNTPFVPFYNGHDSDLTNFYSKLQNSKTLKRNFIKSLNTIVPDLEEIELSSPFFDSKPYLIVYQKHIETTLPLAMFGDGTIKLFRLLAEIVINRGNRLMIDEIDTGIYFKRFKNFWKVILQTAKDNDVQLFMTTHNEECIRYFKEVIDEDLPEFKKDVRNITLVENAKTKEVTAHTYDFEQFEHAINVGNEVRA
jgi:AAA15 family ATPase/GTPase